MLCNGKTYRFFQLFVDCIRGESNSQLDFTISLYTGVHVIIFQPHSHHFAFTGIFYSLTSQKQTGNYKDMDGERKEERKRPKKRKLHELLAVHKNYKFRDYSISLASGVLDLLNT